MELIKRKILLEDSIDRSYDSPTWGKLTATTFYLNVMLTQNADDMGLFTDMPYIESTTATTYSSSAMTSTDFITLRFQNKTDSDFFNYGNNIITGTTESKLEDLMSYDKNNKYISGFDIDADVYENYLGVTINGVNRVTRVGEPTVYTFDAENDQRIGTNNQTSGILYSDYSAQTVTRFINGTQRILPLTEFRFIGEGRNQTNTSLSALTKEEYLFGIISTPEVKSDIFIDRGVTSVLDMHLRMSEINSLETLSKYGNGYYKITRV